MTEPALDGEAVFFYASGDAVKLNQKFDKTMRDLALVGVVVNSPATHEPSFQELANAAFECGIAVTATNTRLPRGGDKIKVKTGVDQGSLTNHKVIEKAEQESFGASVSELFDAEMAYMCRDQLGILGKLGEVLEQVVLARLVEAVADTIRSLAPSPAFTPLPDPQLAYQMTPAEAQADIQEWVLRNFGNGNELATFGGLIEEAGEVMRAAVKRSQGIRGTREEWDAEVIKETADTVIKAFDVAQYENFDLWTEVLNRWSKVRERDWINNAQGHGGANNG